MEMSYKSNGKVIDGPLVEGNDLKIKYVDLDDDGRLDVLFQNRFVEGEYAKIIFRPGAPDDDVFKILDYNGCSISWAPFGNVFP
ncbi:MAG: hypothetical protein CMO55_01475 [Verrucomicrobiales bacterium]|nr:hypothetical protein [Verrucomicrobiales bacterium]